MKKPPMNRWLHLLLILCASALFSAIISHGIISWLKIETRTASHWVVGPGDAMPSVIMAGSSLAGNGLSVDLIANTLNQRMQGWGVAGSSPAEWERFQHLAKQTDLTIIVISVYDLNEYFLSDFRANLIPLKQTIKDLRQSHSTWPFSKRILSMYPLTYVRTLFPTAGRSDGVMVGVREKLKKLASVMVPMESEAGPVLTFEVNTGAEDYKSDKITDWSKARALRRLAEMHRASQGKHEFNGPKKMAFLRMLRKDKGKGRTVVVVLPVSPMYTEEFLTSELKQKFEDTIAEAQRTAPETQWVRLDQLNELNSNEFFWDLVHINSPGQQIGTTAFLERIREFKSQL